MALSAMQKRTIGAALGLALLLGIPLSRYWYAQKGDHAFDRLAREKHEEQEAAAVVALIARREMSCELVSVVATNDGMIATGCEHRARYIRDPNGGFHREGEIESAERTQDPSGCTVVWSATPDAGGEDAAASSAREAIAGVRKKGHAVRLRVPIEATGIRGLAKLRWGAFVETFIEQDAGPELETIAVPCPEASGPDAAAQGPGASPKVPPAARDCVLPFEAVTEIADCP
jgi:predicted phage gp36 major capsid-like protein